MWICKKVGLESEVNFPMCLAALLTRVAGAINRAWFGPVEPIQISDDQHAKGILFTLVAVLALGPDALIFRLLALDHWTLLVWRGIFLAVGIYAVIFFRYRRDTISIIRKTGRKGILITLLFTGSTVCFISALSYTSVAHTLIIVSASPMFAALLSRVFLGEPIRRRMVVVTVVILGAIFLMVVGDQGQRNSLFGDALAAMTSIFLAATFVATRHARNCDMTPSMALSGLVTALVSLPLAHTIAISSQSMGLIVLLSLLLTLSFTLLMLAPRYIPAPEVSLMMPIETVLGILLVWWIIGEVPSFQSAVGGAIIIGCLTVNSIILMRTSSDLA